MKRALLAAVVAAGFSAAAQAQSPIVGQVQLFAFNFCPAGWLPTDGRLLPIQGNTPLFSLLGTTYGGDGITNFALPATRPYFTKLHQPLTFCIATLGIFPAQN